MGFLIRFPFTEMNLRKRLWFLIIAVIAVVPFSYYLYVVSPDQLAVPTYVNGWSENTSKNTVDYINESLEPQIKPKNFCVQPATLLLMVHVRVENFQVRQVIRQTWGQKNEKLTSVYFLIGLSKTPKVEVQQKLEAENAQYNDIIQENFIDSYNNLTLKSINMLKLFYLHCSETHKYLIKVDDDAFLNVGNVLEMLAARPSEENLLMGSVKHNTRPYRTPSDKWFVSYELYPDEFYPDYVCGFTYIMSANVARKLYKVALDTPIFSMEDVYVTGICAKKANVTVEDTSLIQCNWSGNDFCSRRNLLSYHYVEPDKILRAYNKMQGNKCWPSGSFMEWLDSLID